MRHLHQRFIRSLYIKRLNLYKYKISYSQLVHALDSNRIKLNLPSLVYLSIYEPSSFYSLLLVLRLTNKQ